MAEQPARLSTATAFGSAAEAQLACSAMPTRCAASDSEGSSSSASGGE